MSPLYTRPATRPGYLRVSHAPFIVWFERLERQVAVSEGFEFDQDSVPRLPLIYVTFKNRLPLQAACVHDWLYDGHEPDISRWTADALMCDLAAELGLPWYWRWPIWLGVRLGGWRGWRG